MEAKEERLRVLGSAIARMRENRGLSQAELARRLGYTNHAHLSRVESGKKAPSIEMLFEIADALDVHLSCFFAGL